MFTIVRYALFCVIGMGAFKMGPVRMQTKDTRFCNPNMVGPDNKPVKCYVSKSEETKGLIYPGMDDGKSLTTLRDTFVTKNGQMTVGASPHRPYEYTLTIETSQMISMLQLFNETSYPIINTSPQKSDFFHDFNRELSLEDAGWVYIGLVELAGDKLHERIIYGVNGTDPESGMNFTALAMTGLIPNLWILYTDEADEKIVKLQAVNTFQNNMVYQETVITHWEKLPNNITTNETLEMVYSSYSIKYHEPDVPPLDVSPRPEAIFTGSELTGELTRLYFNEWRTPDWMPRNHSNTSVAPIEYFKIVQGTAAYEFFLHKYYALLNVRIFPSLKDAKKLELPPNCMGGKSTINSSYCLYVSLDSNDTSLAIQAGMKFVDVKQKLYEAKLNISIFYSSEEKVLNFEFYAHGCAVVFQQGVSLGNVNIKVCLAGSGGGKSLLQPDNVTYRGEANISVSFNLVVPVGTLSVTLYAGFRCQGAPNNNITASATIGIDDRRLVVGVNLWVDIFGKTVEHKANRWEFESFLNLKIWVGVWIFKTEWLWSWSLFKAGPVTF